MRLPEFLTELSPVRETLAALEQGENAMAEAVAEKNGQVCVETATGGLTLWERDYGLPVREGAAMEDRRAAVRAAMLGGRTLTPAFLKELCVTLGGERGEVEEDFAHWSVTALAVGAGRVPADIPALKRAVERLREDMRIGVMEADIDSDVDARTMAGVGVRSIQLHTGGMCHLDAGMTEQGLREIGTKDLDLIVLENVGNLVCPAEFDTGAVKNAMILSVPEGHDKPLKYPLIFTVCDALIINKVDVLPYFDFDMDKVTEYARMRNPKLEIFPICARTGEGVDAWCDWLRRQVNEWQA